MKTYYSFMLIMGVAMLTVTSCNDNDGPKPLPNAEKIVLKGEYKAKTTAIRSFAIDLFKEVAAESQGTNQLISPYSINTALNMLWNGAAGETAEQLQATLGNASYTREEINDYSETLTSALLKVDPTTNLKIANSIWADITTPFLPAFVKANQTYYNAEVANVDFNDANTFNVIDKWCLKNTNNKIDRITQGMSTDTKFALVNAVYFKGKWKHKFNKGATEEENFANADGSNSRVQMMNLKEKLAYWDDDQEWKMLQLPYGNRAFSMVILMPYSDKPLAEQIPLLTADKFYSLFNNLQPYEVTVKLPKFEARYSYDLEKGILPALGITDVFNPAKADLSQMSETSMFVTVVKHKTYINVDEEGTEAAAVTVVGGGDTSPGPGQPVNFFVDRPFIYSILENSTGTILFMGCVNAL